MDYTNHTYKTKSGTILIMLTFLLFSGCSKEVIESNQSKGFIKFFGTTINNTGIDVIEYNDSYYVLADEITDQNNQNQQHNTVLYKTDLYGNILFGPVYLNNETSVSATGFILDQDQIVITGTIENSGQQDIWLVSCDLEGNIIWNSTFGGEQNETAGSLFTGLNENYIICGSTESFGFGAKDGYILSVDRSGQLIKQQTFGSKKGDDWFNTGKIIDSGYVFCGATYNGSSNGTDGWVLQVDESLKITKSQDFIFSEPGIQELTSICLLNDSTIITAGNNRSDISSVQTIIVLTLSKILEQKQSRTISFENQNYANSIIKAFDNNIVLTGYTTSLANDDAYILMLNTNLETEKLSFFGDFASQEINSVMQTSDKGFIAIGSTSTENNSLIVLIKTSYELMINH